MNNTASSFRPAPLDPRLDRSLRRTATPKALSPMRIQPSENEPDTRLMTLEEAAVAAGVSVRTLARYRKSGALEVVKIGRRVLCSLEAVREAMVKRGPQRLGRELLGTEAEALPLSEWWDLALRLAEEHPDFETLERLRRYAQESARRLGNPAAGSFRVADLTSMATGDPVELATVVAGFPGDMPVIAALRALRVRLAW